MDRFAWGTSRIVLGFRIDLRCAVPKLDRKTSGRPSVQRMGLIVKCDFSVSSVETKFAQQSAPVSSRYDCVKLGFAELSRIDVNNSGCRAAFGLPSRACESDSVRCFLRELYPVVNTTDCSRR